VYEWSLINGMKLHWFSPLAPARTDIANFTRRILPALVARADVTLWTDQAEWDPELSTYAEVRSYSLRNAPFRDLNAHGVTFYNLGNSLKFHDSIYHLSRLHPGAIIVHDIAIHHLIAELYREKLQNFPEYRRLLIRHYGRPAARAAEPFWTGRLTSEFMGEHFPLFEVTAENSLALLVHTQAAYATFAPTFPGPIVLHPLPYAAGRPLPASQTRAPEEPLQLIIFGHLGKNRRLEATLHALHLHPHCDRFRLKIYGQMEAEIEIRALITKLGLDNIVSVRGYASDDELDAALSAADLAINLRYPTMGEASGSQLRIWEHSLPSIVTRVGWYSELPADSVGFVDVEDEIGGVQKHLHAFLDHPEQYRKMGENGRRVLETAHRPDLYAQAILKLAEDAICFRAPAAALRMVSRMSSELAAFSAESAAEPQFAGAADTLRFLTHGA
jgi:glycosyltransferase involved in cell wall biosynthesis